MPKFEINHTGNSAGAQNYQMRWVNLEDLEPDPRNEIYSIDNIESLAQSIEMSGLLQPPVVRPLPIGGYLIISGHRRVAALKQLAEKNSAYSKVQVLVDNDTDEISTGLKLIDANIENRVLSNAEMLAQAVELTRLLTERKKQEGLSGRVRDMVAKRLGMSAGSVGELMSIENNLNEKIKEVFKQGKITKSMAVKISKMNHDTQEIIALTIDEDFDTTMQCIEEMQNMTSPQTEEAGNVSESDTRKEESPIQGDIIDLQQKKRERQNIEPPPDRSGGNENVSESDTQEKEAPNQGDTCYSIADLLEKAASDAEWLWRTLLDSRSKAIENGDTEACEALRIATNQLSKTSTELRLTAQNIREVTSCDI